MTSIKSILLTLLLIPSLLGIQACTSQKNLSINSGLYLSEEREAEIQKEIVTFIESFEASFNSGNVEATKNWIHFPNYRLSNNKFQTIERFDPIATQKMFDYLRSTGWHTTDYHDYRFIHTNEEKVHLDVAFSRYKKDGSKIGQWRSIYIITKEDARWGIKFRSSWAALQSKK